MLKDVIELLTINHANKTYTRQKAKELIYAIESLITNAIWTKNRVKRPTYEEELNKMLEKKAKGLFKNLIAEIFSQLKRVSEL